MHPTEISRYTRNCHDQTMKKKSKSTKADASRTHATKHKEKTNSSRSSSPPKVSSSWPVTNVVCPAAVLVVVAVVAIIFKISVHTNHLSLSDSFEGSNGLNKQKSHNRISKKSKREKRDAFLKWFQRNGGVFHPIDFESPSNKFKKSIENDDSSIDGSSKDTEDNDEEDNSFSTSRVTLEEFPSFGGWGLALSVPNKIISIDSSQNQNQNTQNECKTSDDNDFQCINEPLGAASSSILQRKASTISNDKNPIIHHLDPLFTIPASMVLSVQSVLDTYANSTSPFRVPNFENRVHRILTNSFPSGPGLDPRRIMGLMEQDIVLGIHLMVEECQHHLYEKHVGSGGKDSYWGPYLDVLPQYMIPRLDTFGDEEYAVLGDTMLETEGRRSKRLLETIYLGTNGRKSGSDGDNNTLQSIVREMIQTKLESSIRPSDIPSSCFSFETFHRFVAIISSRAMVLKGVKHLTPLAEMINYKSKETDRDEIYPNNDDERRDTKVEWIPTPFDLYHTVSDDNSITVRSDRDVFADVSSIDHFKADGNAVIHIYEDYGPVDSSLFLQAHGFVPDGNPYHCAIIPKSLLLPNENSGDSSHQKNVRHLFQALKLLKLVYPGAEMFDGIENVCVKKNLEITENGRTVGRKPASDSIAIATLLLDDNLVALETEGDSFPSWSVLKQYCINAINSGDVERIEIRCARYPGSDKSVRRVLRKAARALISEDNSGIEMVIDSGNDIKMDQLRSQLLEAREHGKEQLAIALQFRIEERKILVSVANSKEIPRDGDRLDESTMHLRSNETDKLDESILEFNAFVETLGLPVNKIEPKVVGNGIRIGAFATELLNVGDAYISLPPTAVIGVDTALAHASKTSPDLGILLRKYSKQQRDGFNVLLLFLLHERFVLGKKSVWWPYLNLLPDVSDLRDFHPLFFSEQEIDKYLAGSDVRKYIYRYQQGASERHTAIASDIFAAQVLGGDVLFDRNKFYWACAILDGRSIWWEGKITLIFAHACFGTVS